MDPAIGRFTSVDPLAEKYYSWSPYAYVANNPLRYIDPDGKFKIDVNQAKGYPRLANYLQYGIQEIQNNPRIMAALMKYSYLSESQIKDNLTWGHGPTVTVSNMLNYGYDPEKVYGLFTSITPSALHINQDFVQQLEDAEGLDREVLLFIVAVTILHEYVHYGEFKVNGLCDPSERGNLFEYAAYGVMHFHGIASTTSLVANWIQGQRKARQQTEKKKRKTKEFMKTYNLDYLEEGHYTWDGDSWERQ